MTAITVKPLTKDRIIIDVAVGYKPVIFKLANGGAEVVVLDNTETEATRFGVAPPASGEKLTVEITGTGNVDINYARAHPVLGPKEEPR